MSVLWKIRTIVSDGWVGILWDPPIGSFAKTHFCTLLGHSITKQNQTFAGQIHGS